jgi:hypothetical protein
VSKEINHHRIQITEYYLAKFAWLLFSENAKIMA